MTPRACRPACRRRLSVATTTTAAAAADVPRRRGDALSLRSARSALVVVVVIVVVVIIVVVVADDDVNVMEIVVVHRVIQLASVVAVRTAVVCVVAGEFIDQTPRERSGDKRRNDDEQRRNEKVNCPRSNKKNTKNNSTIRDISKRDETSDNGIQKKQRN